MRERLRNRCKWVREHGAGAAALLALLALVALLVLQLVQGPPDGTTLVLIAAIALLLFGLLAPAETNRVFQRMTNLKVAGVLEIGMQSVTRAEILSPPLIEDENLAGGRKGRTYAEVVDEVEDKLRFVQAITHMHDETARDRSERQIALWLGGERLLSEEEAEFALDLVSNRELGIEALPKREREQFLDAAWPFAERFRFRAWDQFVRRRLQKHEWVIADFPQGRDHLPDFLAHRDGRWALISTKVGEVGGYPYTSTRDRLEKAKPAAPIDGRCIVFPGGDRGATVVGEDDTGKGSQVKVLDLVHLLENPGRAFTDNPWNDDSRQGVQPDGA